MITSDDVLAWMASRPKRERPVSIRSDSAMLRVWLMLRENRAFRDDVIYRHDCETLSKFERTEHAVGNAWGWAASVYKKPNRKAR